MSLGARIKAARVVAEMSQGELAAVVGVTPSALSRWESDEREPAHGAIVLVAARLGRTMAYMTGEAELYLTVSTSGTRSHIEAPAGVAPGYSVGAEKVTLVIEAHGPGYLPILITAAPTRPEDDF